MASVSCYGVKSVVAAAQQQDIPAWAIFEGKSLRFKYDGDDMGESLAYLQQFSNFLKNSTACYTLRFYEEPGGKINNDTKYNGSFNFRMTEDEDEYWRKRNSFSDSHELQQRVLLLESKLAEQDEEEEEPQTITGALMGVINDPQKLYPLLDVFNTIRASLGFSSVPSTPAAVAGAHRIGATATAADVDDLKKGQRVAAALDTLEISDPKIVEHLEKLAALSKKNKPFFDMVIKQLDNLQV